VIWVEEARSYCPNGLAGNVPFVAWMGKHLNGGLLVDCGANVGAVCVATLLASPGSRAVAFEPQSRVAKVLEKMAKANGVDVELHRAAVSSTAGETVLKYPAEKYISGWGSIADEPKFLDKQRNSVGKLTETVQVTTLDDWWDIAGRPDVQVVKVDTQGAECDVLEGGWKMFTETAPFLFIEKHGPTLAEHGRTVQDLLDLLTELGYSFKPANNNNLYCRKDGTDG